MFMVRLDLERNMLVAEKKLDLMMNSLQLCFVGWPTILVTVYGFDFWGRDVVRGYGSLRIPIASGR